MRRLLILLSLAAATTGASACASFDSLGSFAAAPWTPMTVADWPAAPEGPFRAQAGERMLTQRLSPALSAVLLEDARPLGVRAPEPALAGARLFGVKDEQGETRYCVAPEPGEPTHALTCLEDVDGDGAFDIAWSASPHPDFALSVARWSNRRALVSPARFGAAPAATTPQEQVAIRYLGRTGARYGFALQVGGADGFTDVTWSARAAWLAPDADGVIEFAGARIAILAAPRQGGLIYRLDCAMTPGPLTLQVSTAARTFGALVALESPA